MRRRLATSGPFPYLIWCATTTLLLVLQHVSSRVLREPGYRFLPPKNVNYYLDGWSQFDGPEYLKIVTGGYWYTPGVRSPVVWFPLYPLCVRFVNVAFDNPLLAGIIVSSIGGLAAVGLYWRWLTDRGMTDTTRLVAFLFLLTYPYAWYLFGVVHSDALFLALALGAFILVERKRLLLAGLIGALATATRPTGLALIPALLFLALERNGVLAVPVNDATTRITRIVQQFDIPIHIDRRAFRTRLLLPLLACVGVGSYMLYLGVRWGDPLAFQTNQTVYHPGNLPLLKRQFLVEWRDIGLHPTYTLTVTFQALVAAVVACSIPFVGRRFGWGYAVFIGVLVAIPTVSTEDFMGTGRYMIAAFPVAALLGEWLSRQRYRWSWLAVSGTTMVLLSMGFARSWYLT